jgi:cytochrome c peroxidase
VPILIQQRLDLTRRIRLLAALGPLVVGCHGSAGSPALGSPSVEPGSDDAILIARLQSLSAPELPPPPADPSNRFADDPRAAALGKRFFFDTRFSGPLLDSANNGQPGTLGHVGDAQKVACASCHVPSTSFLDTRSSRGQISLGSGWSHRRAPSLLDVSQQRFLNWDGRRDTAFSQPFTPIEDVTEFNSSRLFAAQQIIALYRSEYEAIFGELPELGYDAVAPADAGCTELQENVIHGSCDKLGQSDDAVTQIIVNMGKAIQAYTRKLSCGRSRFDAWVAGDPSALSEDEHAGALLFVGKAGCIQCHAGPYLTDLSFHNVGLHPDFAFFVGPIPDGGAADGLAAVTSDPLNSKGKFSDGYDGRLDSVPNDLGGLLGAFKTPSLRCVSRRPSFMHTGQFRSLEDVVIFFNRGGNPSGYPGTSENKSRNLTDAERGQVVAFLRALDGDGPDPALTQAPELPADPTGK